MASSSANSTALQSQPSPASITARASPSLACTSCGKRCAAAVTDCGYGTRPLRTLVPTRDRARWCGGTAAELGFVGLECPPWAKCRHSLTLCAHAQGRSARTRSSRYACAHSRTGPVLATLKNMGVPDLTAEQTVQFNLQVKIFAPAAAVDFPSL